MGPEACEEGHPGHTDELRGNRRLSSTMPRIAVARPRPGATGPLFWKDRVPPEDERRHIVAEQLYATLKTSHGDIELRLLPNHAPRTVRNFVELARGEREWTNPTTGERSTARLYDGTVFHRVMSGFMIQGGDPLGNGIGDRKSVV